MTKTKTNKIFKAIFIFSVFSFVSSVGCKLYFCNSIVIKNEEFEKAFAKRENLEKEIEKLSYESSKLSSIVYIEDTAKEMGFVEMTDGITSIDLDAPIQVAALTQK